MRVYIFAMLRGRWFTQCLDANDLNTSVSGFQYFESFETLIKALRYLGAAEAALEDFARRSDEIGRGSIVLDINPERVNLLGVRHLIPHRNT